MKFFNILYAFYSVWLVFPKGRTHKWLSENKDIKLTRLLRFNYDEGMYDAQLIIVLDKFGGVLEEYIAVFGCNLQYLEKFWIIEGRMHFLHL